MKPYIKHLKNVFLRFIVLLLLFQLARLWFYYSNSAEFDVKNIGELLSLCFYGLRYDLSVIGYIDGVLLILFLVPGRFKFSKIYRLSLKVIYVVVNSLLFLSLLADSEYFKFAKKRATAFVFDLLGFGHTAGDGARQIPYFIVEYWFIPLAWIFFTLALIFFFFNSETEKSGLAKYKLKTFAFESTVFLMLIFGVITAARGGLQLKPITVITAAQYAGTDNASIILNTPFTIMKSLGQTPLEQKSYFTKSELATLYTTKRNYAIDTLAFQKKNVVIIILESFSKEYSGFLNKNKGSMPFLDSIMQVSYSFKNAYANGTQSVEAVPSIISGIPSLSDVPFITSSYANNNYESIGSILAKEGYNTSFFHGGHRGTMGFRNFAKATSIDSIFEMPEYPNKAHYDGRWGIYDAPFLQFFAKKLNAFPEPFFSYIFTLSSHHPFKLPKEFQGKFKDAKSPVLKTVR